MKKSFSKLAIVASAALVGLSFSFAASAAQLQDTCAGCHGKDGASTDPEVPIIGGMSAKFISDTLAAYKSGERYCPEVTVKAGDKKGTKTTMCAVAKELSPADVAALAKYFSGQKFVHAVQTPNPALVAKGKEVADTYCDKCHSNGGSDPGDDASLLSGQWMPYLTQQFQDFQSGKRQPPKKMADKLKQLQPSDYEALVNYFGSGKP